MTQSREDLTLAPIELVVLARCSSPRAPTEKALAQAVREFALPSDSASRAVDEASRALAALRKRALVTQTKRTPTEPGYRALRTALSLSHVPSWKEVHTVHLPARALGLAPGSAAATEALHNAGTMVASILSTELGLEPTRTVNDLCDSMIAEALGIPNGPLTLERLRTLVLARRAKVEPRGTPTALGAHAATRILGMQVASTAPGARGPTKVELSRALARRWIEQHAAATTPRPVHVQVSLPEPTSAPPPKQPPGEALLSAVRDTLPKVGPDGRFGTEKVFVSAIWRDLERDQRISDLSLEKFKRWLVSANREGQLVLARADLVGAMDARLVADSEIEDQGATFHFVIDQRSQTQRAHQRPHAR